ncbi:MAG: A/G-specific adenine glycosylase [Vulcanimicrobiota bacterium]
MMKDSINSGIVSDYHSSESASYLSFPTSLDRAAVERFQTLICHRYQEYGRKFPWRDTVEPYHVVVSEIMLQQTQVERVCVKYPPFIDAFPDFPALAGASLSQIYPLWQGLGYNRRALALKKIAEKVVNECNGILPDSPDSLQQFPGIGKATAASICVFAFNRPYIFIETNIRSVFIHFFFKGRDDVKDSEIIPLIEKTLHRENPGRWYNALMDYGAHIKKTAINPSRKSAHHRSQSPFEGSNRKERGAILKALSDSGALSLSHLMKIPGLSKGALLKNLGDLDEEGFIVQEQGLYRIR